MGYSLLSDKLVTVENLALGVVHLGVSSWLPHGSGSGRQGRYPTRRMETHRSRVLADCQWLIVIDLPALRLRLWVAANLALAVV